MNYRFADKNHLEVSSGTKRLHLVFLENASIHVYVNECPKDLIELNEVFETKVLRIAPPGSDGVLRIALSDSVMLEIDEKLHLRFLHDGVVFFEPRLRGAKNTKRDDYAEIDFKISDDAKIYGLGDKMASLNRRGYSYTNTNTDEPTHQDELSPSLYKSINYLLVRSFNRFFGLYFPSTYAYDYDLGKADLHEVKVGLRRDYLDFYLFYGDDPKQITSSYSLLVGYPYFIRMKMLGNQQSRWSYEDEKMVREVAKQYKKNGLPLDYIHLDIHHMDGYRDFTIDKSRFPDLAKLAEDLKKQGIGLVTINDAGIKVDPDYDIYAACIENGWEAKHPDGSSFVGKVWPGDSVFPAYSDKGCREFFLNKAKEFVSTYHIEGIWNDMNEPHSFTGPLPEDLTFAIDGKKRDFAEYHNAFPEGMVRCFDKVFEEANRRPYVFTRAGLATTPKYAFAWNGDNFSLWHHLVLSIPQILSMSLSNFMIDGVDIGGFGGDGNKELLIRWCEANILMPFFRNHSSLFTKAQEPYAYDQETLEIYRKFLEFRYRLIPYLYTLAYRVSTAGEMMVRPLFFNYPEDENTYEINDEYMVGDSLLLAPVANQGQTVRAIYLPKGIWHDYFTGKTYEGGDYIMMKLALDETAVFVKDGTILPEFEGLKSIDKKQIHRITYRVFGEKADGFLYEDDGDSLNYRKGKYNTYHIHYEDGKATVSKDHRGYHSTFKEIVFIKGDKQKSVPYQENVEERF